MHLHSLALRLYSSSGPFWIFVQHGAGRIAVAVKFLVLARILGPEGVGLIGIGLLAIAVAEALSELGLLQSIVQRRSSLSQDQLRAVWGFQLLRATLLGIFFALLSWPASQLFSIPEAFPIFALVAAILFLRGSINLSITLALRDMQMRRVGLFNTYFVLIDAILGVMVAWLTQSVLAVFVAMALTEVMRWLASYYMFSAPPRPTLSNEASEFAAFGKWIWMTNILNLLLNQSDKFVVAQIAGVNGIGAYQIAQRFAQLGIADVGTMISQYMFPFFSRQMRSDPKIAIKGMTDLLLLIFAFGLLSLMMLTRFAEPLFAQLLGEAWRNTGDVFTVLLYGMLGGLLTSVLVPYIKATGKAWIVTASALLQLASLITLFIFLASNGIEAIALSVSIAIWTAMLGMLAGSIFFIEGVGYALWRHRWDWLVLLICFAVSQHPNIATWGLSVIVTLGVLLKRTTAVLRMIR
ncbi:MAG: hypothetical protein CML65_02565 [Rhodobacteraceae bacterium]|nr:hypothetical protein [Paracoccaceae bacterium]|tara:strand:+ start:4621 stop:6015 length:1395 start_codon:yes stop_codon:yes gene_type:complete